MPMGKRSCVITLPSSWLQEQGLAAGDVAAVEVEGNVVIISSKASKKLRSFSADVRSVHTMLHRFLGALYKAGFDDVTLTVEPKQIKIIEEVLKRSLVGFELVKIKASTVHIQRIAELDSLDIDTLVKQLFFSLQVMNEELIAAVDKQDKGLLADVIKKDDNINRLADSARRLLNKQKGDCIVYAFVEQLENIGDAYKNLALSCIERPRRVSREGLELLQRLLKRIYLLYYAFSLKELEGFGKAAKEAESELHEQKDLLPLYTQIFDIHGLAITKSISSYKEEKI